MKYHFKTGIIILFYCVFLSFNSCTINTSQKKVYNGIDAKLYKNTPAWNLVRALDVGDLKLAKGEIEKDSSISNYAEPVYGNSILFWAALNSNDNAVKLLLQCGAEVNKCNFSGDSPLQMAAFYNDCNSPILQIMLEHQPEYDSISFFYRNEALIRASSNCLKKVELLVEYKANPNWISKRDDVFETITPLGMSVVQEKFDIVEYYLIELAVNPSLGNIVNNQGDTISIIELLYKSYNTERTYDQEKTQQHIKRILDFLEKNGNGKK